jgi:hypothetical protein
MPPEPQPQLPRITAAAVEVRDVRSLIRCATFYRRETERQHLAIGKPTKQANAVRLGNIEIPEYHVSIPSMRG